MLPGVAERPPFRSAHASGTDWARVLKSCVADLGQPGPEYGLGFVYCTGSLADNLSSILLFLRQTTRIRHWVGAVGVGVCGSGVEYYDEGGLSVMVGALPEGSFRILPTLSDEETGLDGATLGWLPTAQPSFGVVHGDPRN
ncbi:MAG: histidine kinase, partial [Alphaproteobacteria bacterium]